MFPAGHKAAVDMGKQQPTPHSKTPRGGRPGRASRHEEIGPAAASTADSGCIPRGAVGGKRKAQHPDSSAQHAKHAQHVLKSRERVQSCPSCSAAQIMTCDKLGELPFAQLKLIMG